MFKKMLIVPFFLFTSLIVSNQPIILRLKNSESQTRHLVPPPTDFNYGNVTAKPFLIKKQLASIMAGIVAGGTAGVTCAFLDKHIPRLLLLNWFISWGMRESLVNNFSTEMQNLKISHNKNDLGNCACIASWIAYLLCDPFDS